MVDDREWMQGKADSAAGVREGDVLVGKYRVERVLGVGGMGVVVAAHHIQLDEKVALKFLLPETLDVPEAIARFTREARAAVKIKSEHVARVSDVGTLPNGAPYMVMEYLEGGDLGAWLKERGPLPIEQAVDFVLQASEAIAEAHALGIVHRDLKPANLFCVRLADGRLCVKVLDFGISKMSSAGGLGPAAMTQTSAIMGSPLYMSPEQMRSAKTVNGQTDIWALGVILFQFLTGVPPFVADSLPELALRVTTDPPPGLRSQRPDVPPELEAAVLRCLEKDRTRRFADVAEMAKALLPFAPASARASVDRISGILQVSALSSTALAPAPAATAPAGGPGTLPPFGRTVAERSRGRWAAGAFVAVAGSAAVVAAFVSASHPGSAKPIDPGSASTASAAEVPPSVPTTRPSASPATEPPAAVAPTVPAAGSDSADAAVALAPSAAPKSDPSKPSGPKPRAAPSTAGVTERPKPPPPPAATPSDVDPLSRLRPK
jgi:eukaryotic-like serine/threonine-protein kinase